MFDSVKRLTEAVCAVLPDCTVYLTGSVCLNDYRHGWSDIDMLFLAHAPLTETSAAALVNLRQRYRDDPYIPKIEGGIVDLASFLTGDRTTAVYWGTSGQRITTEYHADCFTLAQAERWILVSGRDVRDRISAVLPEQLYDGVKHHWETIRDYASRTENPIYRCGWMLDIARCLYTLKTGRVAAKTHAGECALRLGWCPDEAALRDALAVRLDPTMTKQIRDSSIAEFNAVLGGALTRGIVRDACFCGHDCGRCLVRCADESGDDALRARASEFYRTEMHQTIPPEQLHCHGGRTERCMILCAECPMKQCCRRKDLDFCIDCPEPCGMYREYAQTYVNLTGLVDR